MNIIISCTTVIWYIKVRLLSYIYLFTQWVGMFFQFLHAECDKEKTLEEIIHKFIANYYDCPIAKFWKLTTRLYFVREQFKGIK